MKMNTGTWMAMGSALGVLMAVVTDKNVGLGVALGAGIGLALGTTMTSTTKDDSESAETPATSASGEE